MSLPTQSLKVSYICLSARVLKKEEMRNPAVHVHVRECGRTCVCVCVCVLMSMPTLHIASWHTMGGTHYSNNKTHGCA